MGLVTLAVLWAPSTSSAGGPIDALIKKIEGDKAKKAEEDKVDAGWQMLPENEPWSDTQKANPGRMVFAPEVIDNRKPDPSKWTDTFDLNGDVIHFRVYMAHSAANAIGAESIECISSIATMALYVDLNGTRVEGKATARGNSRLKFPGSLYQWEQSGQSAAWTMLRSDDNGLTGQGEVNDYTPTREFIHLVVPLLQVGENKLHFDVHAGCLGKDLTGKRADLSGAVGATGTFQTEAPVSTGDIVLRVEEGGINKYLSEHPAAFVGPSRMDDPEAAKQVAKAWTDRYQEEVYAVSFQDADWWMVRHPASGVLTHRAIDVGLVTSASEDRCISRNVSFQQEHITDGKFQESVQIMGIGITATYVSCELAKIATGD